VEKSPILVIAEDDEFSELLTSILRDEGFQVLAAPDGPTGIETARVLQPAAILMDMMATGLDGIDACERLKRDPVLGDVPIVGMTASPDLSVVEKALSAGAEFFLPKPVGAQSLLHVVRLAAEGTAHDSGMAIRRHPRFPMQLPVRCLVRGEAETNREVVGQTGNVSLGGLLLLLSEVVPTGTILRLQLGLPAWAITVEGTPIWQGPQPADQEEMSHGIRLLRFTEDADLVQYRSLLSQTVADHSAESPNVEAHDL
jgi:CheY-like chemotaxis protein